jgi:hypothetical protein
LLTDPARQIWNSFNNRANAGGADAPEAAVNGCLYDRFKSLYNKTATKPSLVIVPARFKSGTLYSQIPSSNADFNVTRATTATRVNASGLIESVASGIPRLDYFASGGVVGCPALLVEPQAQNLALQSEAFNTTWSRTRINAFGSGSVANTTGTLDPYGTNLADYLQEDTSASDTHRMNQSIAVVSGTTYSMTCFLKSAERFQVGLYVFQGVERYTIFNLASGTATATNATGGIENYGNGWYRCRTTFTATASGTLSPGIYLCDDSGNLAYTGTGTKGLYAFGFQFETGSVATSYIPTTTAAVTRNADVINLSGAVSGCIGQTEGTMYLDFIFRRPRIDVAGLCAISSTNFQNRLSFWNNISFNTIAVSLAANNASVFNISVGTLTEGTRYKLAIGYKTGNSAIFLNGVQVGSTRTDAFTFSTSLVAIFLGTYETGINTITNTGINAFTLYTTRLTNTELAALTA